MPLTIICNLIVDLPVRYTAGQALTATEAAVLSDLIIRRVKDRTVWQMKQGRLRTQAEAQAHLTAEALAYDLESEPIDTSSDDAIDVEARAIAREMIQKSLAAEGLDLPPTIDTHIDVLVRADANLRLEAERRVRARFTAALESLKNLNLA